MPFPPPAGTTFLAPLATGTIFAVALVQDHGAVAVCKRLLPRMRAEPAARAAMAREGLILARAHHPALPALIRVGTDAEGPFLLETRVEGASVRALVEGWAARGQPVPPRLVAHVAAAAAEALAELHELAGADGPLGFVHGDLAPDHVVLGPIGAVRFVDLGAARWAGMDAAIPAEDRGTLPYAAPEVARGDAPPDQRADVYALAATLLHLATGLPLCPAQGDAAMLLEIGERGLSPSLCAGAAGLTPAARDALARALRLDPAHRLARARDLAAALSGA
jgi:serine/threonine protein kinase